VTTEKEWTNLETILKTAAEESIGKVKRDFRNGWFDQECEQLTVEKNRKYQSMLQGKFIRAATEEYCDVRRKEKGSIRRKRWIIMINNLNGYKNVILKMTVGSSTSK
jgi:hypothetical protein